MSEYPPPYDVKQPPQQPAGYPQQPGQPPMGYAQQPQAGYAQPPQAGYAQQPQTGFAQQPPASSTVIVQQPQHVTTVVQQVKYGPHSMAVTCPSCNHHVNTTVKSQCCSTMPWLVCGIICLVGLVTGGITWLGCCLIPFCIPDLYDVEHSCPNCNNVIGYCRRLGT